MTTNNWNTLIPTPKATNDFGQPILQDYGVDGLFEIFADWHDEQNERVQHDLDVLLSEGDRYRMEVKTTECPTGAQIVALLSDDMPAMLTGTKVCDFVEDGVKWWIGADAAVGVPEGMVRKVALLAEQGGWHSRQGVPPEAFDIIVVPHVEGEEFEGPFSKHNEEYAMWRMVQDALLVDA